MRLHTQFLPIVMTPGRYLPAFFGAQIEGAVENVKQWLSPGKVYQMPVAWAKCEPSRGSYVWPEVYDRNAALIRPNPLIITIKSVPEWAREWDAVSAPVAPGCYGDYRRFAEAAVQRLGAIAVEACNEPDVYRKDIEGTELENFFGAWVNYGESMYDGGVRYGKFVRAIYPIAGAKLLAGALMMHENSLEFLRGMAEWAKADAVSYHCYIGSIEDKGRIWQLSEEIAELTTLPQVVTETALLADVDSPELRADQAAYLEYLAGMIHYSRVEAVLRYTLCGNNWQCSDVQRGAEPTPEWEVFDGL